MTKVPTQSHQTAQHVVFLTLGKHSCGVVCPESPNTIPNMWYARHWTLHANVEVNGRSQPILSTSNLHTGVSSARDKCPICLPLNPYQILASGFGKRPVTPVSEPVVVFARRSVPIGPSTFNGRVAKPEDPAGSQMMKSRQHFADTNDVNRHTHGNQKTM